MLKNKNIARLKVNTIKLFIKIYSKINNNNKNTKLMIIYIYSLNKIIFNLYTFILNDLLIILFYFFFLKKKIQKECKSEGKLINLKFLYNI